MNPFATMLTPPGCRWTVNKYGWMLVDVNGIRLTTIFDEGFLAGKFDLLHKGEVYTASDAMRRELQAATKRLGQR